MFLKKLYCVVVVILTFQQFGDGKRPKILKRPEEDDKIPQANVVTYSTFGFNDVGSYGSFVPSSSDYSNYMNNFNQESGTRLYAPAFPSAPDSTGFNSEVDSQIQEGQASTAVESDTLSLPNVLQYQPSGTSFFNIPNSEKNIGQTHNVPGFNGNGVTGPAVGTINAPVYGTKLNSKNKSNFVTHSNNTEFNVYDSGPSSLSEDNFSHLHESQSTREDSSFLYGESGYNNNKKNNYNIPSSNPSIEYDYSKESTKSSKLLQFPKVIDFTKSKSFYNIGLDNKFPPITPKPLNLEETISTYGDQNLITKQTGNDVEKYKNYNKDLDINFTPLTLKPLTTDDSMSANNNEKEYSSNGEDVKNKKSFKQSFDYRDERNIQIRDLKTNLHSKHGNSDGTFGHSVDSENTFKGINTDYKPLTKNKPWAVNNYNNDYKTWKNPVKGYEYTTNFSNTNFRYDYSPTKTPSDINTDEVVPASSNIVDLTNYPITNTGYDSFKKFPKFRAHYDDDLTNIELTLRNQHKYKPDDYINTYKNNNGLDAALSTHWGNIFKTDDYPHYIQSNTNTEFTSEVNDEVVHIPKKAHKYDFKQFERQPNEWSSYNKPRTQKPKKYYNEWNNDINTRFKLEEDLLGLRTHDTSQTSYLPSYKPINEMNNDNDDEYKKLIEKWRQSYWRSKYKDSLGHEYESYPTNSKQLHVPVPKPYPIEVPHPVIVPVPQPYPIRVPVPKPVAVPVVRELTVPIEKPVPYPVIKNVPYPVEKPVPVHVEKQVPVPVMKPYPVPVPQIRPVFHHSRPTLDEVDADHGAAEDDDYRPRPKDTQHKVSYAKRPRSSRNRTRRPSRNTYQERHRRRWPTNKPKNYNREENYPQRPNYPKEYYYSPPRKYHEESDYGPEDSDYYRHCKRTGKC